MTLVSSAAGTGEAEPDSDGPEIVLLAPYVVMNWLYGPLILHLRKKYGTRFIVLVSDAAHAHLDLDLPLEDADQIVEVPDFWHMAKQRKQSAGMSIEQEVAHATANEAKYGISYWIDIAQQERDIAWSYVDGTSDTIFDVSDAPKDTDLVFAINGFFAFFEELFRANKIDLSLVWPRTGGQSVCAAVATANSVLTSYLYTAKLGNLAYWATGAFCGSLQHRRAFDKIADENIRDDEKIEPPGRPKYLEQNRIRKRYSMSGSLEQVARLLFFRLEFLWIDIRAREFRRRAPLWREIKRIFRASAYFKKFDKLCERNVERIVNRKFILFAFQNEPEFSVQARCKEFNNQFALAKQLALSLPPGIDLVLKEHAWVGDRRLSFYLELIRLPNVRMASPEIRAIDLIPHSEGVASIGGTVTLEAALYGKPALVFTSRSEFAILPSVTIATSMWDLPAQVREMLAKTDAGSSEIYRRAALRLRQTIRDISFDAIQLYEKRTDAASPDIVERAALLLIELRNLFRETTRTEDARRFDD